jgi:hypothetical protein
MVPPVAPAVVVVDILTAEVVVVSALLLAAAVAAVDDVAVVVPPDAHPAVAAIIAMEMMIKAVIPMYFFMGCSFFCVLDEPSLLSIFKYISFHMLPCLFFIVNRIFILFLFLVQKIIPKQISV